MAPTDSYEIHLTLKALIEQKGKRDRADFTVYQLAKALEMPYSVLLKLMHPDPSKRVHNPKIDTLAKIVDFFKQDGFDITIDDLLASPKSVDVETQNSNVFVVSKSIPIYSMPEGLKNCIGTIDVKLTTDSYHTIAFLSDEDIKPIFKKGSIFILDTAVRPEHDTLIAVQIPGDEKIVIRKFLIKGHKQYLTSYDKNISPIELSQECNYQIVGVVIQVNMKS